MWTKEDIIDDLDSMLRTFDECYEELKFVVLPRPFIDDDMKASGKTALEALDTLIDEIRYIHDMLDGENEECGMG